MKKKYTPYNPAAQLEKIYDKYMKKRMLLRPYTELASEEAQGNPLKYEQLLQSNPISAQLIEEINELSNEYELELLSVKKIYMDLFKTHFITIEEVEDMIDLNYKYLNRNVLPNVSTIYFSRLVRKDVKYYRRIKKEDELEEMLFRREIDIDKSVFIAFEDLKQWVMEHTFTKEGCSIDKSLAEMLLPIKRQETSDVQKTLGKRSTTLVGTETYKQMFGMKYDMQLKRANKERLYIYANYEAKPVSRIPLSSQIQNMLKKVELED